MRGGRPDHSIAAVLGVYSSASTWVFNVVRELSIAHRGAGSVHALFSDSVRDVLEDPAARGRHLVWKLHQPDKSWPLFAALTGAHVVLTLRDPRDAVLSFMRRFGAGLEPASTNVYLALQHVAASCAAGYPGLRYEDRFFEKPQTVRVLAEYLGLPVEADVQHRIFADYTAERVQAFAGTVDDLPPERVKHVGNATTFDTVTHIHRRHIGDRRSGKWREAFDRETRLLLNDRFAPFLRAFGYEKE